MTLFDILPSLRAITVNRTFDPECWVLPMSTVGADLIVGDLSVVEESRRRKIAFYLDDNATPVCQSRCPADRWHPTLVSRLAATTIHDRRATIHVDARLPLDAAIADIAFPGNELAGARMADITIVDLTGHRRTVHAELPPHLTPSSPVVLALRRVPIRPLPQATSRASSIVGTAARSSAV